MKRISFLFGALIIVGAIALTGCSKPTGCTDPAADNYDPDAEEDCCCSYSNANENVVISGAITSNTTWTADNIYELAGKVVVEAGATLTINPGTIVKGRTGTGSLASALVVARGGRLEAEGTADAPIIFTSTLDDIEVGQKTGTNLTELDNGKWGGLIVLGYAPVSAENGDDVAQIEGIPADETFGAYGGNDINDDSGIMTYISIRHGGSLIGEGNEINGLTLGGVGKGTEIHHVEVVGNLDDGVECFGGSVDISDVIVLFQGDDGIDFDQNYSGTIDNFLVMHGVDTDEALEIDGPEGTATDGRFTLSNGTIMTTDGVGSAADLKSGAQGTLDNITFWGYAEDKCIKLRHSFQEDCTTDKRDAYMNFLTPDGDQELVVTNCEYEGVDAAFVTDVYTKSTDANEDTCPLPDSYLTDAEAAMGATGTFDAAAPTIGADLTEFDNWSWSSINDKY